MKVSESTATIYRATVRFFSGTMLSRISGLGRDITMAYFFGTNASVAAFLVALRLAHLLRRVLGEGCLQSAFIPLYEEIKREDPAKAHAFFRSLQKNLSLGLIGVSALLMAILSIFLLFNLALGTREILIYTILMMPSLLFICLYGLGTSLLQCEGIFFLPGVAPVAFNFFWSLGALLLSKCPSSEAMRFLTLFIIGGCFLQWALLLPRLRRVLGKNPPLENTKDLSIRMLKPMSLGIIGIAATQINAALDGIFARYVSIEGPAYLWYAIRIEQLPLALFGVALSGALLPPLTRSIKGGNREKASHFLNSAIHTALVVIIPLSCALFISGKATVSLLYQRGDFSITSMQETAYCLFGYSLGLMPSVLVLVIAPLFFALEDYKTPSKASCIAVLVNCALNFIGAFLLEGGPSWIAIATSLSAVLNAWILIRALKERIAFRFSLHTKAILQSLFSSLVYGALISVLESFYLGNISNSPSFREQLTLFLFHLFAFTLAVGPLWFYVWIPKTHKVSLFPG